MAKVDGHTYCNHCKKETPYHLYTMHLYNIPMMPGKVCNICGYENNFGKKEDEDAGTIGAS